MLGTVCKHHDGSIAAAAASPDGGGVRVQYVLYAYTAHNNNKKYSLEEKKEKATGATPNIEAFSSIISSYGHGNTTK